MTKTLKGWCAAAAAFAVLAAPAVAETGSTTVHKQNSLQYQALGSEPAYFAEGYEFDRFAGHIGSIPWQVGGTFAGMTVLGFADWNWGNSGFRFNDEGFFGKDAGSLGMDKLGHAYTSYLITEYFTGALGYRAADPTGAPITAAVIASGIMTYVEVFDGFSGDHGFAYEDMLFNAAGIGFSVLRSSVPGLRDKLDFRMEYIPSGNEEGFHPITDYSGQKYLLALKLAGFDDLEDTPLRFVELHAGYFARGFTDKERDDGDELRRVPYAAVALNLSELLFSNDRLEGTTAATLGRKLLEYVQVPYTYVATEQD